MADLKIQQSELLQDIRAENSKLEDIYKEFRDHNVAQAKAISLVDKSYDTHVVNRTFTPAVQNQLQREITALRRNSDRHLANIKDREALKLQRLDELNLVKRELESHMSLIKLLPPSKTDRHWIIPKGNKQLGWLPHTSQYICYKISKTRGS